MPVLSDAELSSAIKWEAEQHIPVSLAEVNFEYDVIYRPAKGSSEDEMVVFMVGAPKTTVEKYLNLLEMVGVEPIGLEPEVISLSRAFLSKVNAGEQVATLVCNFGALASSFLVVDNARISVAHSAAIGSLALTRALEKGLALDPSQSEEYKRTYGLEVEKLEGRVRAVLLPVFDSLVREIRKTIQFFISKDPGAHRVGRVIMAGGGANLPGMVGYLAEILSIEVLVGDPLKNYGNEHRQIGDPASYGVATGLAVKEF
jgi:type IV pilus assembly protein PilM